MNFLNKLFSKNGSSVVDDVEILNPSNNSDHLLNVGEDLFVNNTPPTPKIEFLKEKNHLQQFLDKDYFKEGYNDGYQWHSNEILENRLKQLKSEYRYNLDLRIDSISQELIDLQNHKANVKDMSQLLETRIDNQINATKGVLSKINLEKELSAQEEGLVMTCIHKYKHGYLQGTNAFLEENIIASGSGLFN